MINCPHCGDPQLPNTLFCDACAEPVEFEELDYRISGTTMMPLLCELVGRGQELAVPVQPEIVIGRRGPGTSPPPELDLSPLTRPEDGVSRRHARLSRRGSRLYLEDLGSTNGSFVNGHAVPQGRRLPLRAGDRVRLGLLELIFRDPAAAARS